MFGVRKHKGRELSREDDGKRKGGRHFHDRCGGYTYEQGELRESRKGEGR
jgi:hypothetical protein